MMTESNPTEMIIPYALALIAAFLLTVLIERKLIPYLLSKKMGQKILEIGPRWHKNKEGTPTMGGLGFMIASVIVFAVGGILLAIFRPACTTGGAALLTFSYAVLNGLIGYIDDRAKFSHGANEGLTARQKYLFQLAAATVYVISMAVSGHLTTSLYLPFIGVTVELGIFYYILALVLLTGVVNSVNLTDGIDGLAGTVTAVVGIFFSAAAFRTADPYLALIAACCVGGCFGFLVYNFHPAKVFMGDTGSLFLGATVVGCAFLCDNPLIIVIAGIVYIAEAMSDIIQVLVYKLTHKRVFRMAPIHHHFEMGGWSEVKIVCVFSAVTAVACCAAWFGLK